MKGLLQGAGIAIGFAIGAPLATAAWPLTVLGLLIVVVVMGKTDAQAHHEPSLEQVRAETGELQMLEKTRRIALAKMRALNYQMTQEEGRRRVREDLEKLYASD